MDKITAVGIDLAKNVFQIHGVNQRGKAVLRKQLRRDQVLDFFANLPPCLIGMEACASSHHWARKLELLGARIARPYSQVNGPAVCEAIRQEQ
jgi:transposase